MARQNPTARGNQARLHQVSTANTAALLLVPCLFQASLALSCGWTLLFLLTKWQEILSGCGLWYDCLFYYIEAFPDIKSRLVTVHDCSCVCEFFLAFWFDFLFPPCILEEGKKLATFVEA
ncbi:hypothetical protein OIU84_025812 [Salix udensis]|uniref:Uncharacterized protein n=1 Tax=Salix udensis TaxID=889485 RepID=A0AAD6KKG7_9ROSI|nr:hypothetical protein OIU84_025812 [Salix udensis]